MHKLLTEDRRTKVSHEYSMRRLVVLSLGVSLVLAVGIVGLFPSYLLSNSRLRDVEARGEAEGLAKASEEREELITWVKSVNERLDLLSPKLDTDRPFELLGEFLEAGFDGIEVSYTGWKKIEDDVEVTVRGTARDRQSLVAFEEYISDTGLFDDVSFPVSQFARESDIGFEIKLSPVTE